MDSGTRCLQKHEYRNPEPVGKLSPYNHFLVVVVAAWWCWWRRSWFLQQITTLGFFHDFILTLLLWIIFFQNVFKNHCKRWFIYFSWRSLFNSTGFSSSMFEIAFSRETYSLLVSDIFRRIFLHVFNALLMRQADSFIVLYNFSISLYLSSTIVSLPYF